MKTEAISYEKRGWEGPEGGFEEPRGGIEAAEAVGPIFPGLGADGGRVEPQAPPISNPNSRRQVEESPSSSRCPSFPSIAVSAATARRPPARPPRRRPPPPPLLPRPPPSPPAGNW